MDLKDTYNKIASDWFKDHNSDTWWVDGTNHLVSLLPPGASILDIGCGAGHKMFYLLNRGFNVMGADFSEEMIKIAKREVLGAEFKILDLYNIDSIEKTFDCIFAQAVFLHIPKKDIAEILERSKKVLKRDGLFYVAVKELRSGSPDEKVETENDYGYEYKRFFSYFTVEEIQGYFEKTGFTIIHSSMTKVGQTGWVQVIAKRQ